MRWVELLQLAGPYVVDLDGVAGGGHAHTGSARVKLACLHAISVKWCELMPLQRQQFTAQIPLQTIKCLYFTMHQTSKLTWPKPLVTSKVLMQSPEIGSHSRTVLSSEELTRNFPSGDQRTQRTQFVCPFRDCWNLLFLITKKKPWGNGRFYWFPVMKQHRCTLQLAVLVAISVTHLLLLLMDQSLMVLSSEADASWVLSGLNWTLRTGAWCPRNSLLAPVLSATHSRTILSRLAETARWPVRENWASSTASLWPLYRNA